MVVISLSAAAAWAKAVPAYSDTDIQPRCPCLFAFQRHLCPTGEISHPLVFHSRDYFPFWLFPHMKMYLWQDLCRGVRAYGYAILRKVLLHVHYYPAWMHPKHYTLTAYCSAVCAKCSCSLKSSHSYVKGGFHSLSQFCHRSLTLELLAASFSRPDISEDREALNGLFLFLFPVPSVWLWITGCINYCTIFC